MTALAGGVAIIIGASNPSISFVIALPQEYLAGSPFATYLVPGIVLAVVVGGLHAVALAMLLKRARAGVFVSAVAAFAMLIWIFVQMVFIPFSFLQAVYFLAGLAEVGLIMTMLGLFAPTRDPVRPDARVDAGTS